MPRIRVRYLATLYDAVGRFEEEIDCSDPCTVKEALNILTSMHPVLKEHLGENYEFIGEDVQVLVNGRNIEFLNNLSTKLKDGDVIVLIPPAAGGLPS